MLKATVFRPALALALVALVGLGVASAPGQDKSNGKQPGSGPGGAKKGDKTAEAPATHLKAFELTRADPEEVRQVLNQLVNTMSAPKPGQPIVMGAVSLRLAVDPRTRTLFARGTDKELDTVSDLVAVLDGEPGKAPAEGKSMRIVHLKHAKVQEVLGVLNNLGYQGQVIALPKANSLVLTQPEGEAKEIREVIIEKIDVESKTTSKPAKKSN
jgi:type II secretory pathway component GspD/PulD (secretin)